MDLIKSGTYIDIFHAKTCATTKISTVAVYHVVLATLLSNFYYLIVRKCSDHVSSLQRLYLGYRNTLNSDRVLGLAINSSVVIC